MTVRNKARMASLRIGYTQDTFSMPNDNSASLQLDDQISGLLINRMNTAQRDAIDTPGLGLMVFNTDTLAFEFFNGSSWGGVGGSSSGNSGPTFGQFSDNGVLYYTGSIISNQPGLTYDGNNLVLTGSTDYGVLKVVGSTPGSEASISFRSSDVSDGGYGQWAAGVNIATLPPSSFGIWNANLPTPLPFTIGANTNYVGINTNQANYNLDVNGTANVSNDLIVGNQIEMTGGAPNIINTTFGVGLTLAGADDGNVGQLRIVSHGGWTDSSPTTYFQISNQQNNYASFMGGGAGTDAVMGRLQFASNYTTFTDADQSITPVPDSLVELFISVDKPLIKLTGCANQGSNFVNLYDNSGNLLFKIDHIGGVYAQNLSGVNTGDQTITLSGDISGSGTGAIVTTLSNTGVSTGTYNNVTVGIDGRVTAAANVGYATVDNTGRITSAETAVSNVFGNIYHVYAGGPFSTIQSAINQAVADGHTSQTASAATILLHPAGNGGTWNENLTLCDGINIIAATPKGKDYSVGINGSITYSPQSTAGTSTASVTLQGLYIFTSNANCINLTGSNAGRLYLKECIIDKVAGTESVILMNGNNGSIIEAELIDGNIHSGATGCTVYDIQNGTFISYTPCTVGASAAGKILNCGASGIVNAIIQTSCDGADAVTIAGGGQVTLQSSAIVNSLANSNGINISAGGICTLQSSLLQIPSGTGYAVKGVSGAYFVYSVVGFGANNRVSNEMTTTLITNTPSFVA